MCWFGSSTISVTVASQIDILIYDVDGFYSVMMVADDHALILHPLFLTLPVLSFVIILSHSLARLAFDNFSFVRSHSATANYHPRLRWAAMECLVFSTFSSHLWPQQTKTNSLASRSSALVTRIEWEPRSTDWSLLTEQSKLFSFHPPSIDGCYNERDFRQTDSTRTQ